MPADLLSELLDDKLMSKCGLIDHINIVYRRLIVHAPAAIDELQSPLRHELPYRLLGLVGLVLPPPREEGLLAIYELAAGVGHQRCYGRVEDVLHAGLLERVVEAEVVLLERLEPADVIVSVGDEVDGQCMDRTLGGEQAAENSQQAASQAAQGSHRHCRESLDGSLMIEDSEQRQQMGVLSAGVVSTASKRVWFRGLWHLSSMKNRGQCVMAML